MTETVKGCEEARALASRELDHELDGSGLAALQAHLAACAACRADRSLLARVDGLVRDAFAAHPFDQKLAREIVRMADARAARGASAPVARPRGAIIKLRAGGLVAAAAAAIVLVGAGLVLSTGQQPSPVSPVAAPRAALARAYGANVRVGSKAHADRGVVHEDEVVVNFGGAASVILDDGTRVDLHADTAIALHRERDGGVSVIIAPDRDPSSGEVFCEVAKQKAHAFRVITNGLTATVVGTKFLVRATGRESSVAVIEGRVRVASGTQEVLLSREQEAVLENARPHLLARPLADAQAQLAWNQRVIEKFFPKTPGAPATVNSSRPSMHPVERPAQPIDRDTDMPVGPPKQK